MHECGKNRQMQKQTDRAVARRHVSASRSRFTEVFSPLVRLPVFTAREEKGDAAPSQSHLRLRERLRRFARGER
ncbi:hypothetical protein ATB98_11555 [Sinorhizobium saheli]|uniref:Uncharacterized protein n=1 Tax=Sinorhizobium saheli TaxID=36856 RepID=A0A178YDW8_SINSA|nr:hypothetical protein ATB98_11555 [Sinorhizobium saheli]